MSIARRLAALEKAAVAKRVGRCRGCHGWPHATFRQMLVPDPNGPGFIRAPRTLLAEHSSNCLTDDGLQCRECGQEASVLIFVRPGILATD